MTKFQSAVFKTVDDYRSILPRLIVGLVFLSEGIQKFLFPELVGAVICGVLMLIGFSVRVAAIPLLIIMITAITTTKIPILPEKGFWQMAHDSRTDFAMTLLIIFLLIYGAGKLSVDFLIKRKFISA